MFIQNINIEIHVSAFANCFSSLLTVYNSYATHGHRTITVFGSTDSICVSSY